MIKKGERPSPFWTSSGATSSSASSTTPSWPNGSCPGGRFQPKGPPPLAWECFSIAEGKPAEGLVARGGEAREAVVAVGADAGGVARLEVHSHPRTSRRIGGVGRAADLDAVEGRDDDVADDGRLDHVPLGHAVLRAR